MNEFALIHKEIASHYLAIKENTEFNRTKNKMLIHLMDRCLRVASHMIAPEASELAFERAQKNNVDIFKLREKDRNKWNQKLKNPKGFTENKKVAKQGGDVAGNARKELEIKTGAKVVSPTNYKALEEKKQKRIK